MADNLKVGSAPERPKLLDQVRDAVRRKHYSYRTEDTYVHWIKRAIYDRDIVRALAREIVRTENQYGQTP